MHTVGQLDAALALARRLGYQVRLEHLAGRAAGDCEIRGQRWLFVDLSLSPAEQLQQVLTALRRHRLRSHPAGAKVPQAAGENPSRAA